MIFKTNLAKIVWETKYQYAQESELQTFRRVAKALASVEKTDKEKWEQKFLETLLKFDENQNPIGLKCTPGGRITANLGTHFKKATLMNCYISGPSKSVKVEYNRQSKDQKYNIPIQYTSSEVSDNMTNIMITLLEQTLTLSKEGGWGSNFSWIRPRGSNIGGVGIQHPGVVKFLEMFDKTSDVVVSGNNDGYKDPLKNHYKKVDSLKKEIVKKQSRKGAMMAVLNCFSENTEILTNEGWVDIVNIIKRVQNEDILYAIVDSGKSFLIENPIIKEPEMIYEVEVEDGSKIEVTGDHEIEVFNTKTQQTYLRRILDINPEVELIKTIQDD